MNTITELIEYVKEQSNLHTGLTGDVVLGHLLSIQHNSNEEKLRTALKNLMDTIPLDNGNWYLPGFTEACEVAKTFLPK